MTILPHGDNTILALRPRNHFVGTVEWKGRWRENSALGVGKACYQPPPPRKSARTAEQPCLMIPYSVLTVEKSLRLNKRISGCNEWWGVEAYQQVPLNDSNLEDHREITKSRSARLRNRRVKLLLRNISKFSGNLLSSMVNKIAFFLHNGTLTFGFS